MSIRSFSSRLLVRQARGKGKWLQRTAIVEALGGIDSPEVTRVEPPIIFENLPRRNIGIEHALPPNADFADALAIFVQ